MRDRLLRGAIAGILGSLWILAWGSLSFYVLHFAQRTWTDVANQLVMGHTVNTVIEWFVAVINLFIWNGILGVFYVKSVVPNHDGSHIYRAIGLGFASWFLLQSISTLYKLPVLSDISWATAMSNWISITGWGIIVGWLTERWDKHYA